MNPITVLPNHIEHFRTANDQRVVASRPQDDGSFELTFQVYEPSGDETLQHVETYPTEYVALCHINLFLLSLFLVDGQGFDSWINQQIRECQVIAIKRTRFRIWFQMPNCEQYGWRHYRSIGPWDFLPFWEEEQYQDLNTGGKYARWIY